MPGAAQSAFLLEFSRSLTEDERQSMYAEIQEANPKGSARELSSAHGTAMLKAGLVAQERKSLSSSLAGTNTERAVS